MDDAGRWKPTTAVDDRWSKFSAKLGFALMDTPTAAKTASVGDPGFPPQQANNGLVGDPGPARYGKTRDTMSFFVLFKVAAP